MTLESRLHELFRTVFHYIKSCSTFVKKQIDLLEVVTKVPLN